MIHITREFTRYVKLRVIMVIIYVDNFTYLVNVIMKDESSQIDNKNRLIKARNAFTNLRSV